MDEKGISTTSSWLPYLTRKKSAVICREQLRNRASHLENNQEHNKEFLILCQSSPVVSQFFFVFKFYLKKTQFWQGCAEQVVGCNQRTSFSMASKNVQDAVGNDSFLTFSRMEIKKSIFHETNYHTHNFVKLMIMIKMIKIVNFYNQRYWFSHFISTLKTLFHKLKIEVWRKKFYGFSQTYEGVIRIFYIVIM